MQQQINLYQRARPIHMQVSAHSLLAASGVLLVALLSIWAFGQFSVTRLQQQIDMLQQQQQAQANIVAAANTLYQEKIDPAALQTQVVELQQSLQDRRQALLLLRRRTPAAQSGFASRLQALAHPHINGVWLETIVLDGHGGIQSLRGRSLDPDLVATYLHALGAEAALAGTRFSEVQILGPKYVEPGEDAAAVEAADQPVSTAPADSIRFRVDNRLDAAASVSHNSGNAT